MLDTKVVQWGRGKHCLVRFLCGPTPLNLVNDDGGRVDVDGSDVGAEIAKLVDSC